MAVRPSVKAAARPRLEGPDSFWRSILAQAPSFITCLDREGRFLFVNRLARGLTYADVLGKPVFDFLTPASRPIFRRALRGVLRTGKSARFRTHGMSHDGALAWYESSLKAIKRRGRVEFIVSVARDISDEILLQARFRGVFASSAEAICYTSLRGVLLEVNPAFERLTGYSRHELIKQKRYQDLTPTEYHWRDQACVRHLLRKGTPYQFEKEYIRKDGTRVPIRLVGFAVKGPDGKPSGFAAAIEDITQRRLLEKAILEAGAREQSKLGRDLHDTLGQTITGISLLAKSLRGRLADKQGPEASDAARLAELSSLAVRQARGLARGLLPAELHAAGLQEALKQLASNARELFGVHCSIDCPRPVVLRDGASAVQLYHIAQEAVHNAAKHARSDSGVRIKLAVAGRRLRLWIKDRGVGIPAPKRRGGGLGLGIIAHRAKMLGGTLTVRRRSGGGTEVVCECPVPALQRKP